MTTTYNAAFGNPTAHRPVVASLSRPDTSSDAALAAALAESEREGAEHHHGDRVSPSGVKLCLDESLGRRDAPPAPHQPLNLLHPVPLHQRNPSGGSSQQQQQQQQYQQQQQQQQQRPQQPAHAAPRGHNPPQFFSDAELASQLQRVELEAHADATGAAIPSLLFPDLMSQPSNRELALSRTLSRAPSVRVNPHVNTTPALALWEPVVSADRQRLLATLKLYDLSEKQVAGDGNCQFRALSDQLYDTPDKHDAVRDAVCTTLRQRAESYRGYVPDEYGSYCTAMAKPGEWGDHVTLQAAADTYGVKIVVVTSYGESPIITIEPAAKRYPRTLYLSFWAEVHYNSLAHPGTPPVQEPAPLEPVGERAASPPSDKAKERKVLGSKVLGKMAGGLGRVAGGLGR